MVNKKRRLFCSMTMLTTPYFFSQAAQSKTGSSNTYINPKLSQAQDAGASNATLLQNAITESMKSGVSVRLPTTNAPFPILGNIFMHDKNTTLTSHSHTTLEFIDGGLVIDATLGTDNIQQNIGLRNLTINRNGTVGPAITLISARKGNAIRTEWSNIRIEKSSGIGLAVRGSYLHTIHGLYISGCDGNGIDFRKNTSKRANGAGTNSFSVFGGEIQNCAWGVAANDTRNVGFYGYAIEGCDLGGVLLESDNRSFTLQGVLFEHNAADKPNNSNPQYCDIWVAQGSEPNQACSFRDCGFEDGKVRHSHAIFIENGNRSIVIDNPYFRNYSEPPVKLSSGKENTTTGSIRAGARELSGKPKTQLISHNNEAFMQQR